MTSLRRAVFLVHVADRPGADHIQRCTPCGAVLLDNRPWWEGRVMVPTGTEHDGPSWWPPGSLVGTDKRHDGTGGGMTYVVDRDDPLDDDEQRCTLSEEWGRGVAIVEGVPRHRRRRR